ncbi:MAG TPA: FtsX-like permease family protein [Thermoanaerobaculia bacterium]|nr:FtsX-like permease family protein [Thermoanaerobaculia bacterium]
MGKLIWRNLLRNKRRTFLTMASLMLAVVLLTFLTALLDMFSNTEAAADNRLVVRSAISLANPLPESYGPRLARIEGVQAVTPLNWFQGVYINDRPENFFARFSADPATLFQVFPEYQMSDAEKQAWAGERGAFIAGKFLADRYGWKIGDQIFIKGDIYPVDLNLTLRGIYTSPGVEANEKQIFFHRRYLEEAMNNPGIVGTYFLLLDSPDSVPAVVDKAEGMFANSDSQVRAETEAAFQLSFLEMIGNIELLFRAIGIAIAVSIFFITANTMAMAARERTTEVAVLKTLGFQGGQVMGMVVFEAVLVGLLGAALGCALSAVAMGAMAQGLDKVFPVFGTLAMTPRAWAVGLGIGLLVGLVSGVFPAYSASRLRIVDALRRVA